MAKIDARGWVFEIESSTPGTWILIESVKEFSVDRSEGTESAETTTFEDEGMARSVPMQRGVKVDLTCFAELDAANGGLSVAGQRRLLQLGDMVGDEAVTRFRFRHKLQDTWELFGAWVEAGETGGELNDKTETEFSVMRDGKPSYPAVA